jgi:alkylation response protein AidB-like acyl-CoA dehydrogenase
MATGLVDLGEQYEQLRASARAFAREQVAPRAADADRSARYPEDLFEAMRDADLLGLPIPVEHGGAGAGMVGLCVAIEEVSRYCNSAGLMLLLSRLAAGPIMICGDQEQQRRYLPAIAAGRLRGSFCLTEPHAGSDVAAISTIARPDGNGYLLDGRKCYISGATVADFYVVWAKTEPADDAAGIAGFLVDRGTPGVAIGHVDEKMGVRAVPTAEVVLDGVRVPAANRLTKPGSGFHDLMAALNSARPGVAARGLGLAQGALKYAVDYARERRAFGSSLLDIQAVQFMIADLAMQVEAARFLVYAAARLVDSGSYGIQAAPWIAMAKCIATDLAVKASSDCLQILGAAGYMADHPMERYYRDAKQLQIVEGTSQIQRLIVARAIRDGHLDLG